MLIVTWDMQRNLVKQWTKSGARYIWQISFNADTQTITFTGQVRNAVTATLEELVLGPTVVHLPISSEPVQSYNLSYAAPSNTQFPVIKNGPYSFWPVSYTDERDAFCIVVVDREKVIRELINCPGSHNIDRVDVDDAARTIQLVGKNGAAAQFDYDAAQACFTCSYVYTKDDFLFLAQYFNVSLSDDEANAMVKAMPQIDCSLCCHMEGTTNESDHSHRVRRSTGGFVVGSLLGAVAGGIGGFFISGPMGAFFGLTAGYAAGAAIGAAVSDGKGKGKYELSSLEEQYSLVGCAPFAKSYM